MKSHSSSGIVRGFTLVEVMVSVTILSLVMLTTVTGFRTLANTQTSIEGLTGRVDDIRTVSTFLRDTLESSVLDPSGGTGGLALGSSGDASTSAWFFLAPNALEWKSTVLFGEAFGGVQLVRVAAEDGRLVLRWQEPLEGDKRPDWGQTSSRVLVERLEEFSISYRRGFDQPWLQEWDRRGAPHTVRLQLRVAGRYWPDLILRVQGGEN
tara:strand:- start:52995 stop:53621 length:627 start_codon:yes stop_codon:yes gene_type:complete